MLVETKARIGVFAIALGAYLPQFPSLVPEFEGQYQDFKKLIPDSVDPNTPAPVVFAFHGAGGTGDEIAGRSGRFTRAAVFNAPFLAARPPRRPRRGVDPRSRMRGGRHPSRRCPRDGRVADNRRQAFPYRCRAHDT